MLKFPAVSGLSAILCMQVLFTFSRFSISFIPLDEDRHDKKIVKTNKDRKSFKRSICKYIIRNKKSMKIKQVLEKLNHTK